MRFKNLEGKLERKNSKRIISASGGFGPLQMVYHQSQTLGQVPVMGSLEKGTSGNKDAEPQREVDCEISHRLGRRTKHSL